MLVKNVDEAFQRREEVHTLEMHQVRLDSNGEAFRLDGVEGEFELDAIATKSFAKFLGINPGYLRKCPADLAATNIQAWLDRYATAGGTFVIGEEGLESIISPDKKLISPKVVLDVIKNNFEDNDEITTIHRDDKRLHIDVVKDAKQIELAWTGYDKDDAPAPSLRDASGVLQPGQTLPQVGDITKAGVRFLAYPSQSYNPQIQTYTHRLVCSNGMSIPEEGSSIQLKGNTVPEIIDEMERMTRQVLDNLDHRLEQIANLRGMEVPGDVNSFAYQIGRERGLSTRVMDRVMTEIAGHENLDAYDVAQIFTRLANGSVTYRTQMRLQRLGGDMAAHTEHVFHRCSQCERPLT